MEDEIRQIQTMLREISFFDEDIERVIPDGIYGDDTGNSVKSLQRKYDLYETGEVDNDTWDKIVEVYEKNFYEGKRNVRVSIIDESKIPILPGDSHSGLYVIQAMILALSDKFDNIDTVSVTGVFDPQTQRAVENIQVISGITPNGQIDRVFLNTLAELYHAYVTINNVENSGQINM